MNQHRHSAKPPRSSLNCLTHFLHLHNLLHLLVYCNMFVLLLMVFRFHMYYQLLALLLLLLYSLHMGHFLYLYLVVLLYLLFLLLHLLLLPFGLHTDLGILYLLYMFLLFHILHYLNMLFLLLFLLLLSAFPCLIDLYYVHLLLDSYYYIELCIFHSLNMAHYYSLIY